MQDVSLVAEIGINHNGDMDVVEHLIKEAAVAGFDYVKFQKRNLMETVPPNKRRQPKETPWGVVSYMEYKQHLENIDYDFIENYCNAYNIGWFGSPWDVDSVEYLASYNPEYIKVASAMVTDIPVLKAIRRSHIPVIISTGMSTEAQFENALKVLDREQVRYILACTSTYPTEPYEMNMSFLRTLANQYPWAKIGFSNHNPGILFAAASVLYGAEMVEVHVTLDRAMFGSDQAASIEPQGMRKLRQYIENLRLGHGDGNWVVYPSEEKVAKSLRWKEYES